MKLLAIEPTKYSHKVYFNSENQVLELSGECYPVDVFKFFTPIFEWLEDYLQQLGNETFAVNVDMPYFNSSSSKMLLDLFE